MSSQSLFTMPRSFESQTTSEKTLLHSHQKQMLSLRKRALNNGLSQRRALTTWMNSIADLIQSNTISLEEIKDNIPKIMQMFPSLLPNGEAFKKSIRLLSLLSSTNNNSYTKLLIDNGLIDILKQLIKYYYRSIEKYPQDVLIDIKYIIGNIAAEKKKFNYCEELVNVSSVEFLIHSMDTNAPDTDLWALSNLIDSEAVPQEGIEIAMFGKIYHILMKRNEIKENRDSSIYYVIKIFYLYLIHHPNLAFDIFTHLQFFNWICTILLEETLKPFNRNEENIVELILHMFNYIITEEDELTLQDILILKSPLINTITMLLMNQKVCDAIKEELLSFLNNIINLNSESYIDNVINERTIRAVLNSESKEALICLSSMTTTKIRMNLLKSSGVLEKAIEMIISSQDETKRSISYEILYDFLEYTSPQYIECNAIIQECLYKGMEDILRRDSCNENNKNLSQNATALLEYYFASSE